MHDPESHGAHISPENIELQPGLSRKNFNFDPNNSVFRKESLTNKPGQASAYSFIPWKHIYDEFLNIQHH